MTIEAFAEDPWKESHTAYEDSVFNIRPAPEFATAEVLVASLYRNIGFAGRSEREVPAAGREFDKLTQRIKLPTGIGPRVSRETWRTILFTILESPKQPNQSSKRFLQLNPVVPDVALYSGSARLTGNSWNPGLLAQRMLRLGSSSDSAASGLWNALFHALTVGEGDDVWARWLQEEFENWNKSGPKWQPTAMGTHAGLPQEERARLRFPAQQFVLDLEAIIESKAIVTRRQWVSLLEAVMRLGSVAHVLWLCDVNDRLWRAARGILEGERPPEQHEVENRIVSIDRSYLAYGNPAVPIMRDYASRYLVARIGLNVFMWHLESLGHEVGALTSCSAINRFLQQIAANREALGQRDILAQFAAIRDEQARTVACKKGIGSNLVEFGRHVLGQRQTASESSRGYDQGYLLRKKGDYASAPWVVSLGPVAVLALVHCCLREAAGPRSVNRLCQHLGAYGLEVDRDDIASSDLGRKLRMLGLVLDSPDAEGGMLLVPPFELERADVEGEGDE
ncbi:MAG: hypothetical protein IPG75_15295 [Gemmatimonadetes bacterium]|nr:hypothetical protein [Gemmatimonadota bacterium]